MGMRTVERLGNLAAKGRCLRAIRERVLPMAAGELARWRRRAEAIPHPELRRQALASLRLKRFHAEGGSVYAAAAPGRAGVLVPLIVALQTISDYLDNLCDRSVSTDPADFRQLHLAMSDAVSSGRPCHDYYALHPNRRDGGYLEALVRECQARLAALPGYRQAEGEVSRLIGLYNDLQVFKHAEPARRREYLLAWHAPHRARYPALSWWEFAAATGSTLGVFALFAAAAGNPGLDRGQAAAIRRAYFPWVCGLHILLDYYIDQAEDAAGGDLNFVRFYRDPDLALARLAFFHRHARQAVGRLPDRPFHELVVDGLPALYLSDGKVGAQGLGRAAGKLLLGAGPVSLLLFPFCALHRRRGAGQGERMGRGSARLSAAP